jgi:hypothetical protein
MSIGYWETLASQATNGPTLTAGTKASCIDASALYTMAPNRLRVGDVLSIRAFGRLSTAVTTPGNSSWCLTAGPAASGIKIFDTLPLLGNIVVQTTVPWWLEAEGVVRTVGSGTAATIFWGGLVASTAFLNTAAVATGPYSGVVSVPFNTAPVVGTGFDSTITNIIDFGFTQTTATSSLICHVYSLSLKTSSGF